MRTEDKPENSNQYNESTCMLMYDSKSNQNKCMKKRKTYGPNHTQMLATLPLFSPSSPSPLLLALDFSLVDEFVLEALESALFFPFDSLPADFSCEKQLLELTSSQTKEHPLDTHAQVSLKLEHRSFACSRINIGVRRTTATYVLQRSYSANVKFDGANMLQKQGAVLLFFERQVGPASASLTESTGGRVAPVNVVKKLGPQLSTCSDKSFLSCEEHVPSHLPRSLSTAVGHRKAPMSNAYRIIECILLPSYLA